jgi:hypothetical protein
MEETLINFSDLEKNHGAQSALKYRNRQKYEWRIQSASGYETFGLSCLNLRKSKGETSPAIFQ